jgi:hypothetical protein
MSDQPRAGRPDGKQIRMLRVDGRWHKAVIEINVAAGVFVVAHQRSQTHGAGSHSGVERRHHSLPCVEHTGEKQPHRQESCERTTIKISRPWMEPRMFTLAGCSPGHGWSGSIAANDFLPVFAAGRNINFNDIAEFLPVVIVKMLQQFGSSRPRRPDGAPDIRGRDIPSR